MRIGSSIPPHVARAYGVSPSAPSAPAARVQTDSPVSDIAAKGEAIPTEGLRRLIGGTVAPGVDFDRASTVQAPGGSVLQLYTRAADRIEAATGVQLGRNVDISG